jgi:hypothetical protein
MDGRRYPDTELKIVTRADKINFTAVINTPFSFYALI